MQQSYKKYKRTCVTPVRQKGSPGTSKQKTDPKAGFLFGGTWRTRTAVLGFADRYLAARSRYHLRLRLQR